MASKLLINPLISLQYPNEPVVSHIKNKKSLSSVQVFRATVEVVMREVERGQFLKVEQGVGDTFLLQLVVPQV